MYYFAYGSNLSRRQMRYRCPNAKATVCAVLPNHALAFGGYSQRWEGAVASVVPAPGLQVEGLLYRIDEADLLTLDAFEGHPHSYEREVKVVRDAHGKRRRAAIYLQLANRFEPLAPAWKYFQVLYRAYHRLGFDVRPLLLASGVSS
jgi:gamma-glutamylcyclotransferase (GGCT)/AIG2-like uncharacterized protein YtfP